MLNDYSAAHAINQATEFKYDGVRNELNLCICRTLFVALISVIIQVI